MVNVFRRQKHKGQKYGRQKYRRQKITQKVITVFLLGLFSVSFMEAAHVSNETEHKNFVEIKELKLVKTIGLEKYMPEDKEELSNANTDKVDNKDNFSDAVFIGDSRTEGLQINTGLTSARFLAAKGLKVDTALKDNVIKLKNGSRGTVIDGLKEGTYNRVYIMFGMNELGWPYLDVFTKRYEKLIKEIKKIQPNATIYVQSILPVSKEKSDKDPIYNNKNIRKFNIAIKKMADKNGYTYLDVSSAVAKGNSYLPNDASFDGVHLNKEYSEKWLNYLRNV